MTATIDYSNLNLSQLIEAYYSIKNELEDLDIDYNEHFTLDPAYTRQYKRLRKPYEDKLEALIKALTPFYIAECEVERRERLMVPSAA